MKRFCHTLIPIFILILLVSGCNKSNNPNPVWGSTEAPDAEIQHKSISILNMSDLEIIKKSSDFLKSCGKTLIFEETRILYENNLDTNVLCKNKDNKDVSYKGEYLAIYFYPHAKMQEQENILIVYIGDGGQVLGYREVAGA